MKKIIAVAVAAMAAVVSQAATISWTSGALTDASGKSPAAGGVTAYAFVLDSLSDWEALNVDNADLTKAGYSQNSKVSKGKASADIQNVAITGTESTPQYVAIFYKDNTSGSVVGYKTTAYVNALGEVSTGAPVESGVFADAVAGGAGYGKGSYNAISGKFEPITPVPEPTAVALIALGLAAFGLKRKVA